MVVLKSDKKSVIDRLQAYVVTINGGKVKRAIRDSIESVYRLLRDKTTEDARYVECTYEEADGVLTEYLKPIMKNECVVACVYLDHNVSVYCKEDIERVLGDAVKLFVFPTNISGEKIKIYVSFMDRKDSEDYDIDLAARTLLHYWS